MDDARDLTLEEQVLFGVRYGMSKIAGWDCNDENDLPCEVGRLCMWMASQSTMPLVGWTKGIHWVCYGSSANIRMFLGSKRFSFILQPIDGKPKMRAEIWADPKVFATVKLFADEIKEDVLAQVRRLRVSRTDIQVFASALAGLNAENFPKWCNNRSKEEREDPLNDILYKRYEAEYNVARDGFQKTMRDILLRHSRARGARYISIDASFFCILEDVRTDGVQCDPVAHQIAQDLNFFAGPHDSYGAKAMNLFRLFGNDMKGIWFVDTDEPLKVHDLPIPEYSADVRAITAGPGKGDQKAWFEACGAVVKTSRW